MNHDQTGWVFFDGACAFCRKWLRRVEKPLLRRGFRFEPLQTDWVAERIGVPHGVLPEEMKVVTREGDLLGGIDAVFYLARFIWWAWPITLVAKVPGVRALGDRIYRRVARRRYCGDGSCEIG